MIIRIMALVVGIFVSLSCMASIGTVIATQKTVEITRAEQTLNANRGTKLEAGDAIKTGAEARAQIKLTDGTLITLGGDTEFVIDTYQFQGEQSKAAFTLVSGAFRTVTGLITKVSNPNFHVTTPLGSIGIRGTDFWGGYLADDAIYVLLIDSEHSIRVANAFGEITIDKPVHGTILRKNEAPQAPYPWPEDLINQAVATIKMDDPQ